MQKSCVNLRWCPDLTSAAQPHRLCAGWDRPVASRDRAQIDSSIGHWFSERPWTPRESRIRAGGWGRGLAPISLSTLLTPQTSARVPTARLSAFTHTHAHPEPRAEALVLKPSSSALCTRRAKSLWKRFDTSSCFLSGSQVALHADNILV